MNGSSQPSLVVALLQVIPLIFSALLDIVPLGMTEKWESTAKEYFADKDLSWEREGIEWRYKHISIFLFDRVKSKYTLLLSLVYIALIFFLNFAASENDLFILLGIITLILGYFWIATVNWWYRIETEARGPDPYFSDYYSGKKKRSKEWFYNYLPGKGARKLNPKRVAIFTQFPLVALVFVLNFITPSQGILASFVVLIIITTMGGLLYF